MKLTTKLGLGVVGLGLLANISSRCLSNYYSNQKNNAAAVLKTSSIGKGLDRAIVNFEKYEGRRNYVNGIRNISYIIIPLGAALAIRKKIRINFQLQNNFYACSRTEVLDILEVAILYILRINIHAE